MIKGLVVAAAVAFLLPTVVLPGSQAAVASASEFEHPWLYQEVASASEFEHPWLYQEVASASEIEIPSLYQQVA